LISEEVAEVYLYPDILGYIKKECSVQVAVSFSKAVCLFIFTLTIIVKSEIIFYKERDVLVDAFVKPGKEV